MDNERIIKTLAKEFPHSIKEQNGDRASTPNLSWQDFDRLRPLIHELAARPKEQEEFSGYTNLMITQGHSSSQFMPDSAASFLCQRATKVGREMAVDNLAKVFSTKEADLICIMVLRGIRCAQVVQLTKDVRLLPIPLLPPSRQRESFLTPSGQHDYARREEISAFNPSAIIRQEDVERAALVMPVRVQQFLYDSGNSGNPKEILNANYINKVYKTLDEIRLCLTSTGLGYPLEELRWQQYSDDVLEDAVGMASRSYCALELIPLKQCASGTITEEIARPLVEGYFKLPDNFRGRMKTALKHLNQAMCHSVVGDKAVDLSVALECLLLGTEKGDNNFKVALRAALAAHSSIEQRAPCRRIIQSMYGIRSNLVHNGIDNNNNETVNVKGQGSMPARGVVKKATDLTVLIIQNLIKNGKEPDWFDLEMSGKPLLTAE